MLYFFTFTEFSTEFSPVLVRFFFSVPQNSYRSHRCFECEVAMEPTCHNKTITFQMVFMQQWAQFVLVCWRCTKINAFCSLFLFHHRAFGCLAMVLLRFVVVFCTLKNTFARWNICLFCQVKRTQAHEIVENGHQSHMRRFISNQKTSIRHFSIALPSWYRICWIKNPIQIEIRIQYNLDNRFHFYNFLASSKNQMSYWMFKCK